MKVMLVLYLVLAVPLVVAILALARRNRSGHHRQQLRDAEELQASRELIDRLLEAAIDRRDVDSVLAPLVIDEVRAHQRSLRKRRDPGSA